MEPLSLCLLPIRCDLAENDRLCGRFSIEEKLNSFKQKDELVRKICAGTDIYTFPKYPSDLEEHVSALCNTLTGIYSISRAYRFFPDKNPLNGNPLETKLGTLTALAANLNIKAKLQQETFGKPVIGLLGHFSSAKSSFLNSFLKFKNTLPVDDTRTTAIPTYIIASKAEGLMLENTKNQILLEHKTDLLLKLKHGSNPCEFQWQSIIKSIYYFSKDIVFKPNVIYLDLPGTERDGSDDSIAIEAVSECDKILYFVDIGKGGLSNSDIKTLKAVLQKQIPLLIILSKADNKTTLNEALDVLLQVKKDSENVIGYENIVMYTKNIQFISDANYKQRLYDDYNKIKAFVDVQENWMPNLDDLKAHYNEIDEIIKRLAIELKVKSEKRKYESHVPKAKKKLAKFYKHLYNTVETLHAEAFTAVVNIEKSYNAWLLLLHKQIIKTEEAFNHAKFNNV